MPPQQGEGGPSPVSSLEGRTILGRYRIIEVNRDGGFGTVNICWDRRLQRRVAIKQIPLRGSETPTMAVSTREEALAEARTACLLSHPNIIQVFDFESGRNDSYIVMEFVDGLSLNNLLARVEGGVLTFDECAHMLSSVASALSFAHENGVLHLDIKPANIMIDRTGTVKLTDFGMATLTSAAGYGGARGGTIGYMPPEQIRGESVDERTDVFSLAVVVYEALTGESPFLADTARESLRKIERGPKRALSSVEPALAGMVEETIMSALDPDPANRPASVEDFSHDVCAFLGDAVEGRASLTDLVGQAESDEPGSEEPPEDDTGVLERWPWLPSAACRAVVAICAGLVSWKVLPFLLPSGQLLAALVIAAASLAWPPLGSMLTTIVVASALGSQPGTAAFPLALLVLAVGVTWWVAIGRRDALTSASVLLPMALPCPAAGSFVAGYALSPGKALVTGLASWAGGAFVWEALTQGMDPTLLAEALRSLAADPATWASLVTAGVGALCCSAAARSRSAAVRCGGEVACLVMVLLPTVRVWMENAQALGKQATLGLMLAVVLCVIMCMVTVLVGPHAPGPEGEETQ